MEPKAKTIIERHGFKDCDRKKHNHDEMQIWVYKNFRKVLQSVFPHQSVSESIPLNLILEYAITDRNFIVGFIDVYCSRFSIAVEIKTEIPMIGELIRQIHFYRKYLNTPYWIVVSPDDRPADILREQGIYFFKYKGPQQLLLFS